MKGLQQIVAFAETAKHGNFAAAARELGAAPSTVAKAVARLEGGLGVKLFHRTTRQVRLSADGQRLYERSQRILAEVEALHADATGTHGAVAGTLRVDAPLFYGKYRVLPLLSTLLQAHPGLQLDLRLNDDVADLVREGIDIAVRVGRLRDSSLVARRVDSQGMVLVASPAYLARHGTPRRLEDLARHVALVYRLPASGRNRPWQFRQRGQPVVLNPSSRLRISDGEGLVEAVGLGMGLCQMPDYMAADALARGFLVEVLPALRPEPLPISLVVASGRLLPARVKVALEALTGLRRPLPATAARTTGGVR